jgi:tripartite-type tricarboxylate transporter receptor subunit TctC
MLSVISLELQAALRKVLVQKKPAATIAARGVAVEFMDANQTNDFMKADTARWQKVAKYAGISLD